MTEPEPELPAILRDNAGETCLVCGRPNADDYPFCSSCCDAGRDIVYTRGANAAFDAMFRVVKAPIWTEHDDRPPISRDEQPYRVEPGGEWAEPLPCCPECRHPPGIHKMDCSKRR